MVSPDALLKSTCSFDPPLHKRRRSVKVALLTPSGSIVQGIKVRLKKSLYDDWKPEFIVPVILKYDNRSGLSITSFPISQETKSELEEHIRLAYQAEYNRVRRPDPFSRG